MGAASYDEEAWLAMNTFQCERLEVRMHPRQCKINQRQEHPSCINCRQEPYLEVGNSAKKPAKRESGWQKTNRVKREYMDSIQGIGVEPMTAHINSGDIEMAEKAKRKSYHSKCKIEGCEKYVVLRGMCTAHARVYPAEEAGLSPVTPPAPPVVEPPSKSASILGVLLSVTTAPYSVLVPMDYDLYMRTQEQGIDAEDIRTLVKFLVEGELCWRDPSKHALPPGAPPSPSLEAESQPMVLEGE
jgi:hypothetical protein